MAWNTTPSAGGVLLNKTLYNNEDADSLDMLSPLVGSWFSLRNPNITIKYNVQVIDFNTGQNISSGSNLPVGKKITFRVTHDYSDVTWFGSGSTNDSPYGDWSVGATPPSSVSCNVNDFASGSVYIPGSERTFYTPDSEVLNQYYLLRVNPPSKTLINTDGLTCDPAVASGDNKSWDIACVVNKTGALSGSVNFASTTGKYYGRLGLWGPWYPTTDSNPATDESMCSSITDRNKPDGNKLCCVGNNNPLTHYDLNTSRSTYGTTTPYILNIPTQTIPFTFIGVPATNLPPTAPVVDGPVGSSVDSSNNFNFVSTDPDNDTLRYGIDWDTTDGVDNVDQWIPGSDYVASGITQHTSKAWSVAGSKTFKVLAQDNKGANSPWTLHSISICSSGNKYCSVTNSCILNASCCGGCTSPQSCVVGGTGYGSCENPAPVCSLPLITPTVTPSFVARPTDMCTLKWNVTSTNSGTGGSGLCTAAIKCYVDNQDKTSLNSSGVSIPVGTHSLSCGSNLGTSTVSVKCKLSPSFGEF